MKGGKSKKILHTYSRRQKNNSRDLVDRISALPDSVLGLILSLLPTKNVVATSVLSKRWKLVWTTVHNLDFCLEGCSEEHVESENMKFVGFVNHVLLHHEAGLLNKFHLVWKPRCISSHARSWIITAIRRNVHELFLCVKTPVGPHDIPETLGLPISIFNCDSLQSLELKGDISLSAAIVVCLPRLESLKLISVAFQSEEAFEKLVSGCPQLTYLHLHLDFFYEDDFTYIISSTSLRRLEVCFDEYPWSLNLKASSLEYVEIIGYISHIFVQKGLSSLVEAYLRIQLVEDDFSNYLFAEAVRAFDCAKALTLHNEAMQVLGRAKFFLSTEFKRLVKFEAQICCSCDCSSLHDLIEHAESLEVLTIIQEEICMHENNDDHPKWTNPVEVPRCLSSCLKTVVFEGYRGLDNEREIIGYILKHGSALEVIKIHYAMLMRENAKLVLVQEICKLPRKSPVCAVEFFSSRYDYIFAADDSR